MKRKAATGALALFLAFCLMGSLICVPAFAEEPVGEGGDDPQLTVTVGAAGAEPAAESGPSEAAPAESAGEPTLQAAPAESAGEPTVQAAPAAESAGETTQTEATAAGSANAPEPTAQADPADPAPADSAETVGGIYSSVYSEEYNLRVGGQEPADPVTAAYDVPTLTVNVDADVADDSRNGGIDAHASSGGELDLSVASTENGGIYAAADDENSSITIGVEDDVTGNGNGITAVSIYECSVTVEVGGSVEGKAGDGIWTYAVGNNASTEVKVVGDVTGSGNGVYASASVSSDFAVEVGGSVEGKNGDGIHVEEEGENGSTEVKVMGDVTGSENGIVTEANKHASVKIEVGGDVTGSLSVTGEKDTHTDIVIAGTLSAGETAVKMGEDVTEDNLSLTVWKIETGAEQLVEGSENFTDDSIRYIIRVEQPEGGGDLCAVGTTGEVTVGGETYGTAKAGETVTLYVDLGDGFRVKSAYNGDEELTVKGEDGNYYIIVPKGGGVLLRVELEPEETVTGFPPEEKEARFTVTVVEGAGATVKTDSAAKVLTVDLRWTDSLTFRRETLEKYQRQGYETVEVLTKDRQFEIGMAELLDLAPDAQLFTLRAGGEILADYVRVKTL